MADERAAPQQDEKGRFVTGNSGGGRQKGSRNKLGEEFIQALYEDFKEHGVKAVETVRQERPQDYLKVLASILPKELHVKESALEDMSADDIRDAIASIRSIIAGTHGTPTPSRANAPAERKPN